tara:strand:+ start:2049 stop:2237 length:189 start_codon:yes stop_codon:yes gene_type:complete
MNFRIGTSVIYIGCPKKHEHLMNKWKITDRFKMSSCYIYVLQNEQDGSVVEKDVPHYCLDKV